MRTFVLGQPFADDGQRFSEQLEVGGAVDRLGADHLWAVLLNGFVSLQEKTHA
jgi:hypothetical protein